VNQIKKFGQIYRRFVIYEIKLFPSSQKSVPTIETRYIEERFLISLQHLSIRSTLILNDSKYGSHHRIAQGRSKKLLDAAVTSEPSIYVPYHLQDCNISSLRFSVLMGYLRLTLDAFDRKD
jgi:hypothetical protein